MYSQDSLMTKITIKNLVPLDSNFMNEISFKKRYINIYGEYHDFDATNKLASFFFNKLNNNSASKIYFVEGGASFGYIIEKYNKNKNFLHYKWGTSIIIDKEYGYKNSIIFYNKLYNSDKSIKFIGYDCEISFHYSLICLYDIIKSSESHEVFSAELKYFDKKFKFFDNNKKLNKLCLFYINSYINDSVKYKSNIPLEDFKYYREIIRGLRSGLTDDCIQSTKLNYYEKNEYRENYLLNNITSKIEEHKPDLVFIQTGLLHSLDTFIYSANKLPWISLSERLSVKYGKENVTKIGLIRLSDVGNYNYTIFSREFIEDMKKQKKIKDTFIDLEYAKPYIKTKFDYAILIE